MSDDLLVPERELRDLFRHSEHDVEVVDREKLGDAIVEPSRTSMREAASVAQRSRPSRKP
jgi:hypothetical protein